MPILNLGKGIVSVISLKLLLHDKVCKTVLFFNVLWSANFSFFFLRTFSLISEKFSWYNKINQSICLFLMCHWAPFHFGMDRWSLFWFGFVLFPIITSWVVFLRGLRILKSFMSHSIRTEHKSWIIFMDAVVK